METAERQFLAQRLLEPALTGDYDLADLNAIHCHLFQEFYAWSVEIGTVEIARADSRFDRRPLALSHSLRLPAGPAESRSRAADRFFRGIVWRPGLAPRNRTVQMGSCAD